MELKHYTDYSKEAINDFIEQYNRLVIDGQEIDRKGLEHLIGNEVFADDGDLSPHYEIPSYITKSGHAEIMEFDFEGE